MINGGIRLWLGANGGSVYIDHVYTEGDYSHLLPPILWIGGQANVQVHAQVNQSSLADQLAGWPAYTVINDDAQSSPDMVVVIGGNGYADSSLGPATIMGNYDPYGAASLTRKGQQGVNANHLFAQTDVARSSPQSIRFRNLVTTSNDRWRPSGGLKITNNLTDRDGGKNAAQATAQTVARQEWMTFGESRVTGAIGDIYICGVWVRSLATPIDSLHGNGFSGNLTFPINCGLNGINYSKFWQTDQGAPNAGDGEWEWVWRAFKVKSQSNSAADFNFSIYSDALHPVQAYSPVAIHIPAGTISDNEAYSIAMNLRGYVNACSEGMLCDSTGQVPHVNTPQTWTAPQAFGAISVNGEIITAAPSYDQNIFLPGALNTVWTASTWIPDKAVTVTRVRVQVKTVPSGCSTNAVVRLTDGRNGVRVPVTSAANDSGPLIQNFAPGSVLKTKVEIAASGCILPPADANVTLQYSIH